MKKLLEQSRQFERELLANIFANESLIPKVIARLSPDDFYTASYKQAIEVVFDSFKNQKNLINELANKSVRVTDFIEYSSYRKIEKICEDIKSVSNTRKIYSLFEASLKKIDPENIDQFISDFQREMALSVSSKGIEQSAVLSIIEEYKERQQFYKDKFKNGGGIIGISTGYDKLDGIIDGFRPEHLWVVGGYTNMGKTATALNFASNLIKNNKRVVYFSLEMGKIDILSRLLGIMTKQNGLSILKGFPHNEEEVAKAYKEMSDSNLSIYNEINDLASLESVMFEENVKNKVDVFIVDFIQLINIKGARSEYETISTAILELQQLAKKLKSTIIVLSQISNEGAKTNNEVVMSFKGSGSIASAADLAIEINIGEDNPTEWKQKMYEGNPVKMIWNVRKNRHGKVGSIDMTFNGQTGVFEYGIEDRLRM